jgi:hypothetical protein
MNDLNGLRPSLSVPDGIRLLGHLLEAHPTTGAAAKDLYGNLVAESAPAAACWCYIGAQCLVSDLLAYRGQTSPYFFQNSDEVSGIAYARQWDRASSLKRLEIARRLQNYQG